MTRLAGVDLRKGQLIPHSSSLTRDGFWVANGVFEILSQEVDDLALGEAVRRMLDASRQGVPTPDLRRGPSPFAPVLAAVGLRSFAGYARGARHVGVEQHGDRIVVTPSRNGGTKEGFVGRADEAVALQAPDSEELGRTVIDALARSA